MHLQEIKPGAIPKLAILQRVCPNYRVALFSSLSSNASLEVKLFIGDDIPGTKVKSGGELKGVNFKKLRTRFIKIGHRILPLHIGLIRELSAFKPDVILCEGESHLLGYLKAIFYKTFYDRKVGLIHWCFISLPGEPLDRSGIVGKMKKYFRTFFDAFLLYSSFSKARLVKLGIPDEKAFVATNVGDVDKYLKIADSITKSTAEAREEVQLPNRFTVLYTGTLDENKKPEMMLDLAKICDPAKFNFVLLGAGEMLEELRNRVLSEGLSNVYLPGRVTDNLSIYFRSSDVMILPGRGGIVISEAMAFRLPVIVHQADGTEYDLIENGITGFILEEGSTSDFRHLIERLESDPPKCRAMGIAARQLVEKQYTTANMVRQITNAVHFAMKRKAANANR